MIKDVFDKLSRIPFPVLDRGPLSAVTTFLHANSYDFSA
jgi:hypothetical protein